MNFELSEEHRMLQATVRAFVAKEVAPRARHVDESGEFPWETLRSMAKLGLLGLNMPEAYGGSGADYLSVTLMLAEIGLGLKQFDPSLKEESVHLRTFPDFSFSVNGQNQILTDMEIAKKISSQALSARTEKGVAVRQVLAKITVSGVLKLREEFEQLIKEEVNIKTVEWVDSDSKEFKVILDTNLTDELKIEGYARELVRAIQDLRKERGLTVSQKVKVIYPNTPENSIAVEVLGEEIKKKVNASELIVEYGMNAKDGFRLEIV